MDERLMMIQLEGFGGFGQIPGKWYYYVLDNMYNVRGLVDRAGALVERYVYDPYGRPLIRECVGRGDLDGPDSELDSNDSSAVNAVVSGLRWDPRADIDNDGDFDANDQTAYTTKAAVWASEPTVAQAFSDVGNPYMFQGRPHFALDTSSSAETATLMLNDHRARFMDPVTGRWLTRDPLGYVDGMNLFESMRSNPISIADPLGLRGCQDATGPMEFSKIDDSGDPGFREEPWPDGYCPTWEELKQKDARIAFALRRYEAHCGKGKTPPDPDCVDCSEDGAKGYALEEQVVVCKGEGGNETAWHELYHAAQHCDNEKAGLYGTPDYWPEGVPRGYPGEDKVAESAAKEAQAYWWTTCLGARNRCKCAFDGCKASVKMGGGILGPSRSHKESAAACRQMLNSKTYGCSILASEVTAAEAEDRKEAEEEAKKEQAEKEKAEKEKARKKKTKGGKG